MLRANDVYKILDSHLSEKFSEEELADVSDFLSKLPKQQLLNFSFALLAVMELHDKSGK